MTDAQLIPVPFQEQTLYLVERGGEPYAVMKPIVEGMGLAWQVQHRKLSSQAERWGVTKMVIPTAGASQRAICLPLRKLPGWLYSIDHNRVRNELRGKIIEYQNHCDDVLWEHWSKKRLPVSDGSRHHNGDGREQPGAKVLSWKDWAQLQNERADLLAFKCSTLEAQGMRRPTRRMRPVTEAERAEMLALAKAGCSQNAIARRLKRSSALVSYIVRAAQPERSEG